MSKQSQVTYRVMTMDIVFRENCLYCLTLEVVNNHGIIFVVLVFHLSIYMIVYTTVALKCSIQCTFVRNGPLILIFNCPGHLLIAALSDRFTIRLVKYVYIIIIVIVIVIVTVIVIIILIVIIIIIIMVHLSLWCPYSVDHVNSICLCSVPQCSCSTFLNTSIIINEQWAKPSHNILLQEGRNGSTIKHQVGQASTCALSFSWDRTCQLWQTLIFRLCTSNYIQ